jgi:hypothetical protein
MFTVLKNRYSGRRRKKGNNCDGRESQKEQEENKDKEGHKRKKN